MILLPSTSALSQAKVTLEQGDLIGLPTETVYGLAADATQDLAVAKIFESKQRPNFNPLIVHGASKESFLDHVLWNKTAEILAETFWPGSLTLVLPRKKISNLSLLVSAGLDSLAIRVPNHPVALELLRVIKGPLAAPSANPSGKLSPTEAIHVENAFPNLLILEGGSAKVGVESTILDLTSETPVLLRPGGIPQETIEEIIGPIKRHEDASIKAPGMTKSHYAPRLPLRLNVSEPRANEAFLGFGPSIALRSHDHNLSPQGDLREAAANLFRMLRELDQLSLEGISVAPVPMQGLGVAINDRLSRAAAPREI